MYKDKIYKCNSKSLFIEDKVITCLKNSVEYFENGKEILFVLLTNKKCYKKKNKILKSILLKVSFLKNSLRQKIFLELLEPNY